MLLRSWLFVPGDDQKKLYKALESAADVLILDLEDSVSLERKIAARGLVAEFLRAQPLGKRQKALYVRINPWENDVPLLDLAAVYPGMPNGIVQPKCGHARDVNLLSRHLDKLGTGSNENGAIKILAIAGETVRGVLGLSSYASVMRQRLVRLCGLTWGPWDLAADMGAASNSDLEGNLLFPFQAAMAMTLFAAKAADVLAIDTIYTSFKDDVGLLAMCKSIRRQGWNGKLAIHPDQVPIIHAGFRPDADEIAYAERVLAKLSGGQEGVASLDGVMLDRPHRLQAERILALRDVK